MKDPLRLSKAAGAHGGDGPPEGVLTLSGKGRWQKGTISNLLAEASTPSSDSHP